MATQRWTPRVTAAAVIEDAGRYLLVEEETSDGLRLNTPSGHLEPGESPIDAVAREALEETARPFEPTHLVGLYMSRFQRPAVGEDVTYLRLAFAGHAGEQIAGRALDTGIVRTLWMTLEELRACRHRHRSPMVLRCLEDHLAGVRYPLSLLTVDATLWNPEQIHPAAA
jgi:8-oxo-dGTP pyrophosphatase MutT (NUDIX family)